MIWDGARAGDWRARGALLGARGLVSLGRVGVAVRCRCCRVPWPWQRIIVRCSSSVACAKAYGGGQIGFGSGARSLDGLADHDHRVHRVGDAFDVGMTA